MKRRDLVRAIDALATRQGTVAVWIEGASHTKVKVGHHQSVLRRHREIGDRLAKEILRQLGGD